MSRHEVQENFDMSDVIRGAVAGALGGLVASWVMNKAQAKMRGAMSSGEASDSGGDEPATVQAAVAISNRVLHHRLSKREKEIAEPVVHYGYGAMMGGAYGAAAELLPIVTMGRGTAYATALFVLGDEVAVPALGLSKPPTEYPVSTHATAFGGHLVYGIMLEAGRRFFRGIV